MIVNGLQVHNYVAMFRIIRVVFVQYVAFMTRVQFLVFLQVIPNVQQIVILVCIFHLLRV